MENSLAAGFTMGIDREQVLGIATKFFEVGFYNQIYYEIVATNKRFILVWMGESYKPWMLRIDPGRDKREELKRLDVNEIACSSRKNISIDYDSIEEVQLIKRNLFKNACIRIKTKNKEYKLFTREKKVDFEDIYETFTQILGDKVIKA